MVVCFLGGLVCLFRLVFFGMVCHRVSSEPWSAFSDLLGVGPPKTVS